MSSFIDTSRHCPGKTPKRRVVVVGAGVGGLCASALLARAGLSVHLVEAAATVGGKLRQVQVGGKHFDAGPTVLTMRWVFDELFRELGLDLDRALSLRRCEVLARHAWPDGSALDLLADPQACEAAIARFAGGDEAQRYRGYCRRAEAVYRALEGPFLRSPRPTPLSLLVRAGWRGLPGMARIAPFTRLWDALGPHFHDPRLRQLFGRYATYCGSSPFEAPATLMLVSQVEREAVWCIDGGFYRLAEALAAAARQHGVVLRCSQPVRRLRLSGGRTGVRCHGVELASGEVIEADAVLFNGDAAALAGGLLGAEVARALGWPPLAPARRSLSAVTWHFHARTSGLALSHHNVFFSDPADEGYRREFDAIAQGRLPAAPTLYLCAQDRDGALHSAAPGEPERLMGLVNAPARADGRPLTDEEMQTCESTWQRQLAQAGLRLTQATPAWCSTPQAFQRLWPGSGGALYGPASQGWRASFQRPGSRTPLPGLYLAGGTVHPGPGVPMAALSGRLAAQQILSALPSTSPFRPVAMRGGISTP